MELNTAVRNYAALRVALHPPAAAAAPSPSPAPVPTPNPAPVPTPNPAAPAPASVSSEKKVMSAVDDFLNGFFLSRFSRTMASQYMQKIASDTTSDQDRVKAWLLREMNKTRRLPPNCSPWQRGCPEKIPLITARPVWNTSSFDWVPRIEASFDVILEELLQLQRLDKSGFQPYRAPSTGDAKSASEEVGVAATDKGSWNVFYLSLGTVMNFDSNRERCPKTCEILDSIPGIYGHSFFSCLAPESHITKHNGPTNKKLRCFLPLICKDEARLRVGDVEKVPLKKGKVLIWDDSFEHESWNDDPTSRITLIFDIWHPEITAKEQKFLSFLGNSRLRGQKKVRKLRSDNALKAPSLRFA